MSGTELIEVVKQFLEEQKQVFVHICDEIFGLKVDYSYQDVNELSRESLGSFPPQFILISLPYSGILRESQYLVLGDQDARAIYGKVMGMEDLEAISEDELKDGLANFFHQAYGELPNQLAERYDEDVQLEFPAVEMEGTTDRLPAEGWFTIIELKGLAESPVTFMSVYSKDLISSYQELISKSTSPDETSEEEPSAEEVVTAHSVDFQEFSREEKGSGKNGDITLDILMNIELPITVELGRTEMLIKDILHLHKGSIIELNKLSGDPVDIFVNNKKFAEGEVVIIDENFGVRITELLTPEDRLKKIKKV